METEESNKGMQSYGYIGYTQALPLDQNKYSLQPDLLLKLAREAVRKQDYYKAIKYLNTILIKNPHNLEAKFFKKKVMYLLNQHKRNKNGNI